MADTKKPGNDPDVERRHKLVVARLRELRERKGITQRELAQQLHVSESAVGLWEAGIRHPSDKTFRKYADYFQVSEQYLRGLSDDPVPEEYKDITTEAPVEMRRLSRLMRKYTPNEILKWIEITKALFEGLDEEQKHEERKHKIDNGQETAVHHEG